MATTMTSKILMGNGTYKPIHSVLVGDKVMGMHGRPTMVKKVNIHKNEERSIVINVKHDSWYNAIPLKADTEVLVWNRHTRSPYWIQSEYYTEEKEQTLLMPLDMKWSEHFTSEITFASQKIEPSYHLGFIFGAYMKIGNIIDDTVSFHCDNTSVDIVQSIRKYMKHVFGDQINETMTTSTYYHDVYYTDSQNQLNDIFLKFKKGDKKFPHEYIYNDFEYIKGIHFGMMLTGTNNHHNFESVAVKEFSYWTSYVLGKPSRFGQMKFYHEGVNIMGTRSSLFGLDRKKVNLMSLQVDCKDDAYIVGNMIVRTP